MIRERHQSSLKLCAALVNETEQNSSWEVTSRDRTSTYTVSLLNNTCPQQCEIRCYDCDICVHIYTCNCADALIRYTICKHIHLVARVTTDIVKPGENSDETPQHSSENLLQTIQDKNVCDIATLRNDLQTSLSGLSWQINMINDIETLRCIRKYINSAANLIKLKVNPLVPTNKHPVNIHIERQRSFFSTKRKREKPCVRLRKPTDKEKEDICTTLQDANKSLYKQPAEGKSTYSPMPKQTTSKCTLLASHNHTHTHTHTHKEFSYGYVTSRH